MSIADKLTSILNSKQAIKDALIEKGVSDVSDVLSEYPEYILNIPTGGGGEDDPIPDIPDIPEEEWTYPEDWPDLEQVLEENQIEGYPYRIIQLLEKGSTTSTRVNVGVTDINNNSVTWNTIVKCSDGGYYDLSNPTDAFDHTWTSDKNEYRWIIYYFKEQSLKKLPPLALDCLYVVFDGVNIYGLEGNSSENTPSEDYVLSVNRLFLKRRILQYIKGINGAIIDELPKYCFLGSSNIVKIDIPINKIATSGTGCFYSCRSLIEVPEIRTSTENVKYFDKFFQMCTKLRSIPETIKTDNGTTFSNMFQNCYSLRSIPETIKTDNGTNFSGMFKGCGNLRSIPETIKTDNCTGGLGFSNMFSGCRSLRSIPETIKTDKGTSLSLMFQDCYNLRSIPETIKTDNCTDFSTMFQNCYNLRSIPETIKTDNGTNFSSMFDGCRSLTSIPETIKTDKGTNFSSMFQNCYNLKSIPETIKTDNGTNFGNMFTNCASLISVPVLNTSKNTSFGGMYLGCSRIEEISNIDTTKCSTYGFGQVFDNCSNLKKLINVKIPTTVTSLSIFSNYTAPTSLTDVQVDISGCTQSGLNTAFVNYLPKLVHFESLGTIDGALDFSKCTLLTYESLINILNSLSTVTSTKTLKLGAINLAKLTEEEIAIGIDKGWSITA